MQPGQSSTLPAALAAAQSGHQEHPARRSCPQDSSLALTGMKRCPSSPGPAGKAQPALLLCRENCWPFNLRGQRKRGAVHLGHGSREIPGCHCKPLLKLLSFLPAILGLSPSPKSKATEPFNLLRLRKTQGLLLLWFVAISFALLLSAQHFQERNRQVKERQMTGKTLPISRTRPVLLQKTVKAIKSVGICKIKYQYS